MKKNKKNKTSTHHLFLVFFFLAPFLGSSPPGLVRFSMRALLPLNSSCRSYGNNRIYIYFVVPTLNLR